MTDKDHRYSTSNHGVTSRVKKNMRIVFFVIGLILLFIGMYLTVEHSGNLWLWYQLLLNATMIFCGLAGVLYAIRPAQICGDNGQENLNTRALLVISVNIALVYGLMQVAVWLNLKPYAGLMIAALISCLMGMIRSIKATRGGSRIDEV